MSEIKQMADRDQLNRDSGGKPVAGHDQWVREKIRAALKAKREGRATYKPLREIAAKYDINSRYTDLR